MSFLLSQLSVYKGAGGIQALMKSNQRKLAEEDESIPMASEIPCTIIRAGFVTKTLNVKFKALTLKRLKLNLNNNGQMVRRKNGKMRFTMVNMFGISRLLFIFTILAQ